jgi:hypothetical protein
MRLTSSEKKTSGVVATVTRSCASAMNLARAESVVFW